MNIVTFKAKAEIISLAAFFIRKLEAEVPAEKLPEYMLYQYPDQVLMPHAVMAFAGDADALAFFTKWLLFLAEQGWGVAEYHKSGLDTSFRLRNLMFAYIDLCKTGLIASADQARIDPWLYEYARIKTDGTIEKMPGFEQWHQKNQHVPTSVVYLILERLKNSPLHQQFNLAPLLAWANGRMVGWNITWRCPDDSWLYGYIWILSAYCHASTHAPELLHSENARKSFDWYKKLSNRQGIPFVFGETHPGDYWGPLLAYLVCASVQRDGEALWMAEKMLRNAAEEKNSEVALFRASEMYLYYKLWPCEIEPVSPTPTSCDIRSPLPGRGWAIGSTTYNDTVKLNDTRFPRYGIDLNDEDDLYMERNPDRYREDKPDKIIFTGTGAGEADDDAMLALLDLRAQGTHDHPDALGIVTLIAEGVPWLVESVYMPREVNRIRHLHNVPLFQRGFLPPAALLDFRSDTWQEPESKDVLFEKNEHYAWALAGIRNDNFDYVNFNNGLFDVERFCLFVPGVFFLVADRLISVTDAPKTFGQIWHTTARVTVTESGLHLARNGKNLYLNFAGGNDYQFYQTSHEPVETDPFYFTDTVKDLLWHGCNRLQGTIELLATVFSKENLPLTVEQKGDVSVLNCGDYRLEINGLRSNTPVKICKKG